MKKFCTFFILCLMVLTTSCSIITVSYDYDQEADFTRLATFDWLPIPIKARTNELTVKHVKRAVNRELEAKGFKRNPANPDFLIALHVRREKKVDIVDWGYTYAPHDRYYGYHDRFWRSPNDRYWRWPRNRFRRPEYRQKRFELIEYVEGTIILDLVDASSKELIWRGTARGEVDPDRKPEKRREAINKAVAKILENFPPIPK